MNKRNLIIASVTFILALGVGGFWYTSNSHKSKVQSQKLGTKTNAEKQEKQVIIGQGKDEVQKTAKINELKEEGFLNAFLEYLKKHEPKVFNAYKNKELHIAPTTVIFKNVNSVQYFRGVVSVNGQHSAPYVLAIEKNNKWQIIFRGGDHPSCKIVDKYNVPFEIYDVCIEPDNSLRCFPDSKSCY